MSATLRVEWVITNSGFMNETRENQQWREDAWRARPSGVEEARLRSVSADPGRAEELRLERRLTTAIQRLEDAPVPSNFTSRVLQEALRAETSRARDWRRVALRWLPRLAFGCVLLGAGFFSWQHFELSRQADLARSVAAISNASVPSPEILKDFEAIRALSSSPPADEQLLALMQ